MYIVSSVISLNVCEGSGNNQRYCCQGLIYSGIGRYGGGRYGGGHYGGGRYGGGRYGGTFQFRVDATAEPPDTHKLVNYHGRYGGATAKP